MTEDLIRRQSSCGHVFISNGSDPICVHCGISQSKVGMVQVQYNITRIGLGPGQVYIHYHYGSAGINSAGVTTGRFK